VAFICYKDLMKYFLNILFFMICAGCGIKQHSHNHQMFRHQEIIAKLVDLPDAPFQVALQFIAESASDPDQIQLSYTTTMAGADLVVFYQQQMERLGWDLFAELYAQDLVLHYVKPDQICLIVITDQHLSIYICKKKRDA